MEPTGETPTNQSEPGVGSIPHHQLSNRECIHCANLLKNYQSEYCSAPCRREAENLPPPVHHFNLDNGWIAIGTGAYRRANHS
jgi:hypothetical protein